MILTDRRQKQAIRDLIAYGFDEACYPPEFVEDLGNNYRALWSFVRECQADGLSSVAVYQELVQAENNGFSKDRWPPGTTDEDKAALVKGVLAMTPGSAPKSETLDVIGESLSPVTWLWPGWVPRGYMTILASESGVGKSTLVLDLFRRVIHGLPGPDARPLDIKSGTVVYVEAENFLAAIHEEAKRFRVDTSRLYVVRPNEGDDILDLGKQVYRDKLLETCFDARPDLVALDSFSTIQTRGENSVEETRGILNWLGRISESFGFGLVLLHHLRKPKNESTYSRVTLHDIRGSGHLGAMSRSAIGVWVQGADIKGPRQIQLIKTNLVRPPMPYPSPLTSRYQPVEPGAGGGYGLTYEAVAAPTLPDTLGGDCASWLKRTLAENEPLSYLELKEMAGEAGYKENTLQAARRLLDWKVADTVGPGRKGNKWTLHDRNGHVREEKEMDIMSHGSHGHVTPPPCQKQSPPLSHGHVNHVRRNLNTKPANLWPTWADSPHFRGPIWDAEGHLRGRGPLKRARGRR